ncbi:Protein kinase domain-containing protein [Balamuthia mandrillaris]
MLIYEGTVNLLSVELPKQPLLASSFSPFSSPSSSSCHPVLSTMGNSNTTPSSTPSDGLHQHHRYQSPLNTLPCSPFLQPRHQSLGRWEEYTLSSALLGEGSFGVVQLGYHKRTGERVAVKVFDKSRLTPKLRKRLNLEVSVLSRLQHEGLCKLSAEGELGDRRFVVFEYINGGDLFDYVISRGRLCEEEARHFFGQLCRALHYLHSHGVIHHDVKLENCMIQQLEDDDENENDASSIKDGNDSDSSSPSSSPTPWKRKQLKLIDFNLCAVESHPGQLLSKFSGTEAYCAPELFEGHRYDGKKVDVYSTGCLLYVILTGCYPFSEDPDLQFEQQTSLRYLASLRLPEGCSSEARDLLGKLLDPCPRTRPTMAQVLSHPFLAGTTKAAASTNTAATTSTLTETTTAPTPTSEFTHPQRRREQEHDLVWASGEESEDESSSGSAPSSSSFERRQRLHQHQQTMRTTTGSEVHGGDDEEDEYGDEAACRVAWGDEGEWEEEDADDADGDASGMVHEYY